MKTPNHMMCEPFFIQNNYCCLSVEDNYGVGIFIFLVKVKSEFFCPSHEMFCFLFACFNNSLLINRWDMGLI